MAVPLVVVRRLEPLLSEVLGSRYRWGECWWTARDICLANEPELPDPLRAIADEIARREEAAFLNGTA